MSKREKIEVSFPNTLHLDKLCKVVETKRFQQCEKCEVCRNGICATCSVFLNGNMISLIASFLDAIDITIALKFSRIFNKTIHLGMNKVWIRRLGYLVQDINYQKHDNSSDISRNDESISSEVTIPEDVSRKYYKNFVSESSALKGNWYSSYMNYIKIQVDRFRNYSVFVNLNGSSLSIKMKRNPNTLDHFLQFEYENFSYGSASEIYHPNRLPIFESFPLLIIQDSGIELKINLNKEIHQGNIRIYHTKI